MTELIDWKERAKFYSQLLNDLNGNMKSMEITNTTLEKRLKKHDDLLREICDNTSIPQDYRQQIKERMNG